jgi:UDP-2,4-diacetamido-2,4,6-trideoxy-beta-L-altropyranose hydrolase
MTENNFESPLLLIRADANAETGSGHVLRCLALAEAWQQAGGRAALVSARPAPHVQSRASALGAELIDPAAGPASAADADGLCRLARERKAAWVVLDGYQFDEVWQRRLKEAGLRVLFIDDCGQCRHYWADVVLNQNPGAAPALYFSKESHTRLLLGSRYALLRGEFLKWRDGRRAAPARARKILVTLGGSDPRNVTLKVVQGLKALAAEAIEATVVVGASSPHLPAIESEVRQARFPVSLLREARNMPELMAGADLAIAAGGTTAWEVAFMGLPALLVAVAENQSENIGWLNSGGVARALGWHETLSPAQIAGQVEALCQDAAAREEMSRRGRALIDGLGAFRVWRCLNQDRLRLTAVVAEHGRLIWEWANAPEVRAVSFSRDPIPWERHVEWFEAKLRKAGCHFWLALGENGQPVGQVRFEPAEEDENAAVMSVALGPKFRARNLGPLLIWVSCQKLFAETSFARIHARVKSENLISQRAFEKADFQRVAERVVQGQPAFIYELRKEPAVL